MLPLIRIEEYITQDGVSPFAEWFDDLDAHAATKVNTYLTRIREGNTGSLKPIKGAFQAERRNTSKKTSIARKNFGKNIKKEKKVVDMTITRDFKETIQARAIKDKAFREGLLRESVECLLADDMTTGKALLRDYINATIGFEALAKQIHKDSKSIMRMLSAHGNPTAENLFGILHVLQKREGVQYELQPV